MLLTGCAPWGACPAVRPVPHLGSACPLRLQAVHALDRSQEHVTPPPSVCVVLRGPEATSFPCWRPRFLEAAVACFGSCFKFSPMEPGKVGDLPSSAGGGGGSMGLGLSLTCFRSPGFLLRAVWPWAELLNSSELKFPHLWVDTDDTPLA